MIPPEPTAASAGYASEALPCLVEPGLAVAMIGVGGMGMAPLAIYLSQSGVRVMGYDDNLRPPVRELLESAGVALLDNPELPEDAGMVVRSSAVKETHPALREAARRGTAVLRRGEALARLATGKRLVAVVGSHGKTTTTGMLIWALRESGFTCDYVLGGLFNADVSPACACGSPWLVAEVDESDGTLEGFHPEVTVAVNFDWDHPDQYPTEEALAAAFARIFERTRAAVILHENDQENFTRAGGGWTEKMLTVGEGRDYCGRMAGREGFTLELTLGGRFRMERCQVGAAGAFNARNALMALAAGVHMGASLGDGALASFPGICRRQTVLFDQPGWTVLEDYAHHPSEIDALLESSREAFPDRQMVVVFQPHRYTRTLLYRDAFAASLAQADTVFLLDVYAACEPRLEGGETTDILARMKGGTSVARATSRSGLEAALAKLADAPGVVLFVGAGDIEEWPPPMSNRFPSILSP